LPVSGQFRFFLPGVFDDVISMVFDVSWLVTVPPD